jgi:hypothetical protein
LAGSLTFVPAHEGHAQSLALTMRPEDVEEVGASGYDSPLQALLVALEVSDRSWAVLADGEVAAMFGIATAADTVLGSGHIGQVWFLTGSGFLRHKRAFVRVARAVVRQLLEECGILYQYVDARYAAALRWVKWLGFAVGPPVAHGPHGLPFCPAVIRRTSWE